MSLFSNLTSEGLEEAQDRLGGFQLFDTDAYESTIKVAYAGESAGGAKNVTVIAEIDGREHRETIYITNKKGENFFVKDDKKIPLPGFTLVDDLCIVTTEKPLAQQSIEEKVLKIYDFEQGKEVPKSVPVLTDLTGKKVILGIVRVLENKNVKDPSGDYVPSAETREINTIDKVFHYPTKMTVTEAKNQQEAKFHDAWVERNQGNTRDKRSIRNGEGGQSGRPSRADSGPPQAGQKAPGKSLFGS